MQALTHSASSATPLPPAAKRPAGSRWTWAFLIDIAVFLFVFAAIFGVYAIGRSWLGPAHPQARISQNPRVLPLYAFYSLVRISVAYVLSLIFALAFGYVAAGSRRAEIIMVPLLDILQSIPVLSFLPGVMLAMVALFPHSQLGVELGSILLIFTGQAWNIAFSFYSSLKTIPRELDEAAKIYRFSRWQRFAELDLPFSTIGLVWNSMMSVAGGWFFLMACEMFVLGKRDFRLPGLGSFLQTAASHGNTREILWGVAAMIGVIATSPDHAVIREFFELFKTPWEFYRHDRSYDVVLCVGDGQCRDLLRRHPGFRRQRAIYLVHFRRKHRPADHSEN